jgi:GNAT superfamily N-acetyltransferase
MTWNILRLTKEHDRAAFHCNVPRLDAFLHKYATQYEKRNLGRPYILVQDDLPRVFGYYTLAVGGISKEFLPEEAAKKLPDHPVPYALIGRLALDQSVQGQGLGRKLIANAIERCVKASESVGIHSIFVDAIDDAAALFYLKHHFIQLPNQPHHLFMTIETAVRSAR